MSRGNDTYSGWLSVRYVAQQDKIEPLHCNGNYLKLVEMCANAHRDGHPAKYRWHPLFNAAKCTDAQYSSAVQ